VLPAAGIVDGLAAPHASGTVEIEKCAAAGTRAVLDDKMTVEQNGFDIGEQRIVIVEISPARLHHADFFAAIRVQEIWNRPAEKIGFGKKVGVEDGDEFAFGGF
jgi:hypothetical protein